MHLKTEMRAGVRHGIRTREQAGQANVLERLAGERNCGRKTIDEIARWVEQCGESAAVQNGQEAAAATMGRV